MPRNGKSQVEGVFASSLSALLDGRQPGQSGCMASAPWAVAPRHCRPCPKCGLFLLTRRFRRIVVSD
jgi:hypothetical protein